MSACLSLDVSPVMKCRGPGRSPYDSRERPAGSAGQAGIENGVPYLSETADACAGGGCPGSSSRTARSRRSSSRCASSCGGQEQRQTRSDVGSTRSFPRGKTSPQKYGKHSINHTRRHITITAGVTSCPPRRTHSSAGSTRP